MAFGIEEVDFLFETFDEENAKTFENYKTELQGIRAGRANPHILDKVEVEYYGTMTPLNQMANVTIAEARVLVVSVWDKSALKNVEKAILAANVGITPNNDGTVIRLVFPEVTEERRRALVKDIKQGAEETKIVLRNHRRDINEELKKLKKDSAITEDDLTNFLEEVDKRLAKEIEKVDETAKKKEDEVMSV
ncbi:MAG: ribosome recycling factor [Clostridiales bacterium]|jgi:ribosome recycling factor|nr:ribosome recycling factor [Clostridiales bacterium]MDY2683745.1 ribosome recycling factor [Eubacteriales bacterium]MCI6183470.1 ribosome recycling factor [Clostridiales bacterium]MCI6417695.1 ribosome recycling factor [Clostridiales bacterium]MCI6946258.1 ribosome recycling factor [Clostridiales bacterium]